MRDSFVFRRGPADPRPLSATTLWKRWRRLLKVVSEMLGHSTTAMTLDVYSHTVPAMSKQAANCVGRPFRECGAVSPEPASREKFRKYMILVLDGDQISETSILGRRGAVQDGLASAAAEASQDGPCQVGG